MTKAASVFVSFFNTAGNYCLAFTVMLSFGISVSYAGDLDVTPKHESSTSVLIGESVFASCRQTNPVDTVCKIDCGNGQQFEKATGFCSYSETGTFQLVVNRLEGRRSHFHVATIIVSSAPHLTDVSPPKSVTVYQSAAVSTAARAGMVPGVEGGNIAIQLSNSATQQLLFRNEESALNADALTEQFGGNVTQGVAESSSFMFTDVIRDQSGQSHNMNSADQNIMRNSFVNQ